MNSPSVENLALASESRYRRLGEWIGEHGDEILNAASDPLYMTLGVVGLAGVVGGAVTARAAAPALYYKAARGLAESDAAITWGYRQQRFLDHHTRLPIAGLWSDRESHVQFVAPTRQGKTQALLPIIIQDLEAGRDVFLQEISGDLGLQAESQARARGAQVLKADASDPHSLPFNPIAAPSNEAAAQRAATVIEAIATDHAHYSSMNESFARHFTILARDYMAKEGHSPNDATLSLVYRFSVEHDFLLEVLDAREDEDKRIRIDAPWLSKKTATWLEQKYLRWTNKDRDDNVTGFSTYLDNLLDTEAAERFLCPPPGQPTLDLAAEVSDEADHATTPGEMGRLIMVRLPIETLYPKPARDAAYWVLKALIDSTFTHRSIDSAPLAVILDELPTLVGKQTRDALDDFQQWLANIGKFHVAVHVAYQGWALLPDILEGALRSNGRNIFISGGMSGRDARIAQEVLGSELEEDVAESKELGRADRRRRRQVSVKEHPRYSVGEIQKIPRGQWWLLRFHRGKYRDPIVIRVPMAKMPADEGPLQPEPVEDDPDSEGEQKGEPYEPSQEAAAFLQRPGAHRASEAGPAEEGEKGEPRYRLPGSSNALRGEGYVEEETGHSPRAPGGGG